MIRKPHVSVLAQGAGWLHILVAMIATGLLDRSGIDSGKSPAALLILILGFALSSGASIAILSGHRYAYANVLLFLTSFFLVYLGLLAPSVIFGDLIVLAAFVIVMYLLVMAGASIVVLINRRSEKLNITDSTSAPGSTFSSRKGK